MKTQLHQPIAIYDIGKRKNNEDYIYPVPKNGNVPTESYLFLVCDGVGGQAKGEEASKLTCESFGEYLEQKDHFYNEEDIKNALRFTEDKIDAYLLQNPAAKGMATTLTLLSFHEKGATIAHVGDSRVYQIRNGKIIFQTKDHSLINEMLTKKLITEEQAKEHPQRNVVTRAIRGKQHPALIDVKVLTDIQEEDYFFLCTDGITETINDKELAQILGEQSLSNFAKMQHIQNRCSEHSRDNFSAYLLKIKSIEKTAKGVTTSNGKLKKAMLGLSVFVGISLSLIGLLFFLRPKNTDIQEMVFVGEEVSINPTVDDNASLELKEISAFQIGLDSSQQQSDSVFNDLLADSLLSNDLDTPVRDRIDTLLDSLDSQMDQIIINTEQPILDTSLIDIDTLLDSLEHQMDQTISVEQPILDTIIKEQQDTNSTNIN